MVQIHSLSAKLSPGKISTWPNQTRPRNRGVNDLPRHKKPKCKICGLRKCLCSIVEKNMGRMEILTEPTKYSRTKTIIIGINPNLEDALNKIKSSLGCGGLIEGKKIVLQGDHRQKFGDIAVKLGYSNERIQRMFNFNPSPSFFYFYIIYIH